MQRDVGVCSIGQDELTAVLLLRQQREHALQPAPGLWNGTAAAPRREPDRCTGRCTSRCSSQRTRRVLTAALRGEATAPPDRVLLAQTRTAAVSKRRR